MNKKIFNEQKAYRFRRFARKAYSAFNSMHRIVNHGVVAGCVLSVVHTTSTKAQTVAEDPSPAHPLEQELDEVMVTASRIEMPIAQTAKLVTVITKEQIAQAPVRSIADLLNYAANVDLVQRGGHGVQADISIRGGSADQTAVLLNGINITNPHTGHYSLDLPINLSDIERIEVLHGPAALVYGTGAFSGGINIITKKKADAKAYANVEFGMHELRDMELRGAVRTGIADHSLSVGRGSSDGYIANSDYDLYNVLWQTRLNLKNESKLDFQLGYNDKKYGANTFYTADFPNQYEQTATYMGTIKGEFGSTLKIVPILYWSRHHDQFDLIRDSTYGRNYHRSDTYGANLILSYRSNFGNTSLGGELRREDIMSSKLGYPMVEPHRRYAKYDGRTIASLALEHTLTINRLTLSAGALLSHNTLDDKTRLYPSVSVSYRPMDEWNLYGSWSKSSRLPTFTDLFYTTETHEGNEGLKSEKSESAELGLKYNRGILSAYATGFLMWGRNIIDWVEVEVDGKSKYASWNHTEVNTQGVELGTKLVLGELIPVLGRKASLGIDYARMNQTCDTDNEKSLYSLNYLRDKFTAQLHHRIFGGLSAGWYFRFQKRMGQYKVYENHKDTGRRADYPFFSTLDLKLNYELQALDIYLDLNNFYDTDYFDRGSIPQAGFWLTGGIRYTFR
ncbi:TonB-dependent siderophore receptor [Parabacteroides sp. Marseille-P3160]|uniref:TonB-dependent receptor plug domain-containing protein n=1 Tax=Parabacteroides sp. Marseille-P3160 TaxID=1917887 RepID=UPI0009B96702|nr:TonB-dependent receptor [Parabacteroides sp. Marseille-P3160]